MNLFKSQEGRHLHAPPRPTPAVEDLRQPSQPIQDEMGLLGLAFDDHENQLDRHALTGKPEDYFTCDPHHFHREVL